MITFIDYQYKGVGGVGQLVVNTTLELNRRGKQSKLYCSSESYEYLRLKECHADFVFIDSDVVPLDALHKYMCSDDVIVLTNINDTTLLEKIKLLNNKIVFYSVHPDTFFCYTHYLNLICNQKAATLKLIKCLEVHDSLYFMDWPNVKAVYDRGGEIEVIKYLPVPVLSYLRTHRNQMPFNGLNITSLGRGNDSEKVYPIIKVLEDLNRDKINAKLTIITDVNTMYQQMIKELVPNNQIQIEYVNNLHGEDLDNYLFNYSTLHIAQGTSALEGAKLGIPTVLVDAAREKIPNNYRYRWLYECEDFCLGGEIKNGVIPYKNGRPLKEMIQSISTDAGYKKESEACRLYLEKNHSIQVFVDKLEEACQNTKMTTQDYCKTRFSKNMYYFLPFIIYAVKIKNFIIRKKENGL